MRSNYIPNEQGILLPAYEGYVPEPRSPGTIGASSETCCFGIFKPDAIELGIAPIIEERISLAGLAIVARHTRAQLTADDVQTIWPLITNPHTSRTVPYMTSAPVDLFVVQGCNASDQMLEIKHRVREEYPNDNPVVSVMHTTDNDAELNRCMQYFFPGELTA